VFKRLSTSSLRDIVDIRLQELQSRLLDRRITLEVDDQVRSWLAERGYDPKFGARPLNRLISREIGNGLADKIIRGEVKSGDKAVVKINLKGDGLVVGTAESLSVWGKPFEVFRAGWGRISALGWNPL
jgi:ATP-dependent Clp protease ATP-binding subunit ClpB